jgi:hypothetical protein
LYPPFDGGDRTTQQGHGLQFPNGRLILILIFGELILILISGGLIFILISGRFDFDFDFRWV